MARIERIPTISNPDLLDKVIAEVQKGLAEKLPWLDHSFGKAQRLVKMIANKRFYTPNVYAGDNEYLEVSPDANIGNFSFFDIEDPQTIEWIPKQRGAIKSTYGLVFWFDLRKVRPGENYRNVESIKQEILKELNGGFWMKYGRIQVARIYERAESIYRGYTLDEVDNQFLMHPFAGLRFEGDLLINENC